MLTANFYCACCLKTQAFAATERGYQCPICRKVLVLSEPPRSPTRERTLNERNLPAHAA